jgi:hypothetical protein
MSAVGMFSKQKGECGLVEGPWISSASNLGKDGRTSLSGSILVDKSSVWNRGKNRALRLLNVLSDQYLVSPKEYSILAFRSILRAFSCFEWCHKDFG